MVIRNFLSILIACTLLVSCSTKVFKSTSTREWAAQSNIYEVNVRQYTPTGTFKEFQAHLPRLREMGVEILWFMPITPIGVEGRKMSEAELGSYYAVRNYKAVNPEFGNIDDWKALMKNAHNLGFKVITDWVPNHTAADHPWIKNHPEFYAKDKNGQIVIPHDWTDVRKLDFSNRTLRDSMIDAMKFWIRETGIDGYRCDVAAEIPTDFWKEALAELKKMKDVFMLAEAEKAELHTVGFDATYAWTAMGAMTDLYSGKKTLAQFDSTISRNVRQFPANAYRMYFTTNHDENSWNGTEFEKYGEGYKAFSVFTQTFYQSVPLIYSGQEIPNKKRLKFFVKDNIMWTGFAMAPFYKTLLTWRRNNPALAADASYQRLATTNDNAIFGYVRQKKNNKVVALINFSNKQQRFRVQNNIIDGSPRNVFTNASQNLSSSAELSLEPWDYLVLEYK